MRFLSLSRWQPLCVLWSAPACCVYYSVSLLARLGRCWGNNSSSCCRRCCPAPRTLEDSRPVPPRRTQSWWSCLCSPWRSRRLFPVSSISCAESLDGAFSHDLWLPVMFLNRSGHSFKAARFWSHMVQSPMRNAGVYEPPKANSATPSPDTPSAARSTYRPWIVSKTQTQTNKNRL